MFTEILLGAIALELLYIIWMIVQVGEALDKAWPLTYSKFGNIERLLDTIAKTLAKTDND
jgi:hypothetical protein